MKMQKLMIGFSFIVSILSLIAMIYIGSMFYKGATTDYETNKVSEENIIAYIKTWDRDILASESTSEYSDYVKSPKFDKEHDFSKELGELIQYYSGHPITYMKNDGSAECVGIESQAEFKNGIASINAKMIKVDGKWKIKKISILKKSALDLEQEF
jgi:hypothetical protein